MPTTSSDDGLRASLVALARGPIVDAGVESLGIVDDLVDLGRGLLAGTDPATNRAFAVELLADCCVHLALFDKHRLLFEVIDTIVTAADADPDARSRFRACRIAFASELARGDFRRACEYAERCYRAALEIGTTASRFESLVLVVSMLESMGMWRDACDLALNLSRWHDDDPTLARLQRVNAIHGLRICRRLDDVQAAQALFVRLRDVPLDAQSTGDALTVAVDAAARAVHLAWIGKPRAASRSLEHAFERVDLHAHVRASAILRCAEAEVRIASDDADGLRSSQEALSGLLERIARPSATRSDVLRTMLKVELHQPAPHEPRTRSTRLDAWRHEADWGGSAPIPADFLWWVRSEPVGSVANALSGDDGVDAREPSFSELGFDFDDFIAAVPDACAAEGEASLRTAHYRTVESWTIAAEIAAGGNGRRCLKVGRVAAALGAALGFSDARCVMLEMACRLRDLGRVAVDCAVGDGGARVDPRWVEAERAKAAERMLSFSDEPVLRLAGRVVKQHRAWWNGTGFPGTLRGEEIPVEARICALADALVEMVDPLEHRRRWTIDQALQQIGCMGGVRYDPTLVGLLSRVLRYEPADRVDAPWQLPMSRTEDSMEKAKKHLFQTLELVD